MPFVRNKTRRQIKRDYEDVAHGLALTPVLFIGLIILAFLIGAGIWIWTATSGARGNANVTRQHNSGQNQVAQNTKLLGDNATILADEQKIAIQAKNVATEQDRLDLAGLEQNCQSDVTTYNADVNSILATGYLPTGLPSSYPATVCTPTSN